MTDLKQIHPPVTQHSRQDDARRLLAEHTDLLVEKLINEGTIIKPNWWRSQPGRFGFLIIALISCGLVSMVYQWWLSAQNVPSNLPNGAQIATSLIAAAAGIFAYHQWTDARRETSLEKFYDRLSLVNERYYDWKHARNLVPHFWGPPSEDEGEFQKRMYVYLELDNLEYMIFRYQLGFVRKPLFRRAVRTFVSRCASKDFCKLSIELVKDAGYGVKTVEIVHVLVAQNMPRD